MNKIEGKRIPNGGRGRPKGATNRTTRAAKEAIEHAADMLGGGDRLYEWAMSDPANERVFWGTIYPKLLPLTHTGDPDNPVSVEHVYKWADSE